MLDCPCHKRGDEAIYGRASMDHKGHMCSTTSYTSLARFISYTIRQLAPVVSLWWVVLELLLHGPFCLLVRYKNRKTYIRGRAMASKAFPSLEEILGEMPPGKMNHPCQDEHLCEIARHITDWPALAPLMGISTLEVEEIRGKWPFSVGGQRMEFMRKWKEKHGRKGSYRRLCKAFWKAGEVALAEKVCDILFSQEASSGSSSDDGEELLDVPQLISSPGSKQQQSSLASSYSTSATTAVPSHPLEPLANELRITYGSEMPDFIALQWPPPPTLKVFNLALIQSEQTVRRRPLDENLVRLTMTGNIEDIMKLKHSINLEDLFNCGHMHVSMDRKVILIEGAPGSGKSTLAWHICQKWKLWELFHQDFKVVIYVQLRDLEVQSAQVIADLLPFMLESERVNAATQVEACRGKGVLFILDGWDEYSLGLQQGSLFEKLICHPKKLSVQLSTILITSRPIASGKLQKYATSRVEIVGFTPDEVGRYFEDIFKDTLTLQKLHDHLQERRLIKASCYLPLNAAIVAHLFIELNYILPTTLHGLFCSLVLSCIIRHLTKELGTEPDISSMDNLPPDVRAIFQKVCVIAFDGVVRNKVIFSSEDLLSCDLPKDLNVLSLMQVVQSFSTRKRKSYHFLHLSVQELLAAQHISSLPPLKQVQIFTELFGQPRFDAVFRYYAAFTKLQNEGIRDVVARLVQCAASDKREDEKVRLLNLIHCLYEAQDVSLCYFVSSRLKGALDLRGSILSPMDLLSLKYFLWCVNDCSGGPAGGSDTDSCAVIISTLNLLNCRISSEDIDSLSLRNIAKLNLSFNRLSCACTANILTNNPQLKVIKLGECGLTDDGVELFAAALRDHCSLEVLTLYACYGFTHGLHHILQATLNHCSLRCLDITGCKPHVNDIAAVMEVNESLQVLKIGGEVLTDVQPVHVVLSKSLKKNRTLERLELVLLTPDWEGEFVWSLRDCHLKILGLHMSTSNDTKRELSQQMDTVNKERGRRSLPSFKILYVVFSTQTLLNLRDSLNEKKPPH